MGSDGEVLLGKGAEGGGGAGEDSEDEAGIRLRDVSRHLALGITLVLYTGFGGVVFRELEYPSEIGRLETTRREVSIARAEFIQTVGRLHNATRSGFPTAFLRELLNYEKAVQEAASKGILVPVIEGTRTEELVRWKPLQAIFFASTVITTIGYGNIAPVTLWGRVFCLVFALIGIPLCLTVIADLGILTARALPDIPALMEHFSPTVKSLVSALAALGLLGIFLAIGAFLFMHLEDDWDFFDSFYFCFITMTTIGFGDLVPQKPQYMLLCTLYILVGLGLTSTIIEIVRMEYAKSWERLQALAETLRRLGEAGGGQASVDLTSLQGDLRKVLKHMGKNKKGAKNWEKTVDNLVDSLKPIPKAKPKILQIIIYESSV